MNIHTPKNEPLLVMTRQFSAPREVVWKVMTQPQFVQRWYGGHGFSNPRCEMDVRPGGRWSHLMRTPDGSEFPAEFVFLEVVPPQRLVWRSADFETSSGAHCNVMTVTLTEGADADTTEWRLVVRFKTLDDREAAGSIGFVDVLSQGCERVEELVKGAPLTLTLSQRERGTSVARGV